MSANWIRDAIPSASAEHAAADATRVRLGAALEIPVEPVDERSLRFVEQAYELALFDVLDDIEADESLGASAEQAFQLLRVLPVPDDSAAAARWLVRLGCLGLLADRQADAARLLTARPLPSQPDPSADWGARVQSAIWEAWIRLLRKAGWDDLDAVESLVQSLREAQREYEETYLDAVTPASKARAWELVVLYHLARAVEVLGQFAKQGSVDGRFDVQQQLDAQFDRALQACARAELIETEGLVRLLRRSAARLVENSIWTVTRAVNSRVTAFVESVVERGRERPLFEVLPPQRHALRERGLLGSAVRTVVVSLPTSSGKTLIAQFRMLQALNQFDREQGWVAYLAPTRALVNQITRRLRRDFEPLGVSVERVSPALEVDGLEASLLLDEDEGSRFRVLVATPEKLDLLIRGGWEQEIGRPLTLVVVDEAHNLGQQDRGIRLELLLATVNRECRFSQFLLLTPFMKDAQVLSRWLSPESHEEVRLSVEWVPNDRTIMLSRARRGEGRGAYSLELEPLHTTHRTLFLDDRLPVGHSRPLGLSWSDVNDSPGKIAAATAETLKDRGPSIVLAQQIAHTWSIAKTLFEGQDAGHPIGADVELVRDYLAEEMGETFPLVSYLERGVGVHHAGLSEDARSLLEWLLEKEDLRFLVATTTIAQGVNFPVASVVLASHQYPYGVDMPPQDFWNVAGRTGRIGQGDLGVVALAAKDEARADLLRGFVNKQVADLDSSLVRMVLAAQESVRAGDLQSLSYKPEWSSFLQYLAHSYRQVDDPALFATEVEQVLRGALGYQQLRQSSPDLAEGLLGVVGEYTSRLAGQPLKLVDATGFSWESVSATLARLGEVGIDASSWDRRTLFNEPEGDLRHIMGVILQVPELRANLDFALGGVELSGSLLAQVTSDWVQGRKLTEIASEHFAGQDTRARSPERAITDCCRVIYSKLAPTVSWGLSALQSLTLRDTLDDLPEDERRAIRNFPSRVLYGVNTDAAIALRLLGVPRQAATPLAEHVASLDRGESIAEVRRDLATLDRAAWENALGPKGGLYRAVWHILEGATRQS
jgi:hypothetical protein